MTAPDTDPQAYALFTECFPGEYLLEEERRTKELRERVEADLKAARPSPIPDIRFPEGAPCGAGGSADGE